MHKDAVLKYSESELKNLDWWRGFLAFVVFISHLLQIIWFPVTGIENTLRDIFASLANISVVCFFVLSGILVSYSAENLSAGNYFNWKKYLSNRVTRIYPSLILILMICALLAFLFPILNNGSRIIQPVLSDKYMPRNEFVTDAKSLIRSFFMLHSNIKKINGPVWSLVIEWWLYISGMFFFIAIKEGSGSYRKYAGFIFSVLVLWLAYYGFGFKVIPYIIIWYAGCFYTIYLRKQKKIFTALFYIAPGCLIIITLMGGLKELNIVKAHDVIYGVVQVIFSVLFMKIAFSYSGKYIFISMAKYSYTLYILHFTIILFIWAVLRPYVKNDFYSLMAESTGVFIVVLLLSKYTARITEDKYFFRQLIEKKFLNTRQGKNLYGKN